MHLFLTQIDYREFKWAGLVTKFSTNVDKNCLGIIRGSRNY